MTLKITRAAEPLTVDRLVVCIYAPPGLGKSTVAFSAHKPLMFDFDRGAHRAANRGDSVQVDQWQDVANVTAGDLEGYETLIVDTAGRALDCLAADIIRRNPKMGKGGALSLQGFGQLKSDFTAWVKLVRSFGKDLVLVAHSSEDKSGDDLVERIDMQGGSKGEVYKVADAMGRLSMVPGNKWPTLNFSPSDTAFGKNPGQIEPIPVPDIATQPEFLGDVIRQIKGRLNTLTEAQQERQQVIEGWVKSIQKAEDADAINALVPEVVKVDEAIRKVVKGQLHKRATETLGLEFDKSAGQYVAREAA